MSSQNNEEIAVLIDTILAKLPIVEEKDLSMLVDIMQILETISMDYDIPVAMKKQIVRTIALIEKMVMKETDFDNGLKKLTQSVDKMAESINEKILSDSDNNEEVIKKEKVLQKKKVKKSIKKTKEDKEDLTEIEDLSSANVVIEIQDDLKEMVVKFAEQQQAVLEDFEGVCLEYEKEEEGAIDSLKRMLHTWKGEFGVLDMQNYSKLIHSIEDKLEVKSFPVETLFRLKDLLAEKMKLITIGKIYDISEGEKKYLFKPIGNVLKDEKCEENKERKDDSFEIKQEIKKCTDPEKDIASKEKCNLISMEIEGDTSLLADFVAESREHLDSSEPLLLDLENDPTNIEILNTVFRACHTIKGVAGFLNLKAIQHLSHSIENLMDMARKGTIILNANHIDILFQALDCLRAMIDSIENTIGGGESKVPEIYEIVLNRLESADSIIVSDNENNIEDKDKKIGEILVEQGEVSDKDVKEAVEKQRLGDCRKVGEILVQKKNISARSVGNALAAQKAAKIKGVEETIRVPVERLDQLIDAIGEAVIAQSMISADKLIVDSGSQDLERKISQTGMIMRQIQELSMSLRMVSIKATFQKMARLVRDLSKKTGKQVEFLTDGEDTELDKTVVEKIGDPLIHMIRNSMDHGIELSEKRINAGKPAKAIVQLKAFHRAGNVVIEIKDDGKGLDKEVLLKKAIEKGLAKEDGIFSDQEIFQFIFLPGFSTAKKVTDVSGRGVGMDVVKRNIQTLRGSVEIESERGVGTTFSIKLPLTLAIIDGMVVKVSKEKYIIPTMSIIESIKPKKNQIESVLEQAETINVRNEILPLVRFSNIFDIKQNGGGLLGITDGIVMIVEDMLGKKIGLFVDGIIGQQQVVIKNLGKGIGEIHGVSGGAIMNDGNVSLIVDIGSVVKLACG